MHLCVVSVLEMLQALQLFRALSSLFAQATHLHRHFEKRHIFASL
jgi:hypothetical protein